MRLSEARSPELRSDRAYTELRARLVSLTIAPGSPIGEIDASRELAIGRTSVREAINRLAADGLVTVAPKRGTFASEISITDPAHISEVRIALEGRAASRAAERAALIDRDALKRLRHDLSTDRQAHTREQIELYERVHRFIHRCAANPFMEATLNRYLDLWVRIWRYVSDRLEQQPAPLNDLDRVLVAIAAGDSRSARDALVSHISKFDDAIRAAL